MSVPTRLAMNGWGGLMRTSIIGRDGGRSDKRTASLRRRAGGLRPQTQTDAAPPRMVRRSDGNLPCHGNPLDRSKSRQVSWLTGQVLMHGLPRPRRISVRPGGWRREEAAALCIALTAYSCRDSRGSGRLPSPHSLLSPLRGTDAICLNEDRNLHPVRP